MIQSDEATDHRWPQWQMTLPVARFTTFSTCPGFTVLAAGDPDVDGVGAAGRAAGRV
jgi:hypothetical protein